MRRRILAAAVELANEQLAKEGAEPMPKVRPHDLRQTFASLLFAIGEPPPYVKAQCGHKTANLTLEIYARAMDRRDGEPERLRALVNGDEWAGQPAQAPADRNHLGTGEHLAVEAARS